MKATLQIRRHNHTRRLVFLTIAVAAVFLLLKPENASGGDGRAHLPRPAHHVGSAPLPGS